MLLLCLLGAVPPPALAAEGEARTTLIIVVGAPGEEEFGQVFEKSAGFWQQAGHAADARQIVLGLKDAEPEKEREQLQRALADEPKESPAALWLVFIGHGTFDGREAKFNLHGPDVTAPELAEWLKPFKRPLAVINCAPASGPFITKLSAPGRVVITATKSGGEINYTRFGLYLAEAIADPRADLDKDGQTSLLEAYLTASSRVAEFYKGEGRLATEHSLLDDNGDGLGTPADWFRGVRAVKRAKEGAALDGPRAHQFHLVRSETERQLPAAGRARRDELELAVATLRDEKAKLAEADYYQRLEKLLLELARLYQPNKAKP